ncbi:MAG: arsinothricin resistance N-acetyltransferase ArsN1 family B [Sphingomonadaceae bacterium]
MSFLIRAATPDDAAAIARIYAPYVESLSVSFEQRAPSTKEMARRIETVMETYPWLVAENDGEVVGYAYASRFRERWAYRFAVEAAIYIAAHRQREGIGRRLYMALIRTLSAQGFTQALATIALPNEASIDMHEAVGFQRAGVWRSVGFKAGQWRDVGLWQRPLALMEETPEEPKPFSEVGLSLE